MSATQARPPVTGTAARKVTWSDEVSPAWSCALATLGAITMTSTLSMSAAHAAVEPTAVHFSVRLEDQLLANLRYLPVSFVASAPPVTTTPTTTTTDPTTTTTSGAGTTTTTVDPTTTTTIAHAKIEPNPTAIQSGTFVWRYPTLPARLKALWTVGTENMVLRGALMRFQDVHGLDTTGNMDGATWKALLIAAIKDQVSPTPYNYVYVSQTQPEQLKLYQNGRVTFKTFVNTGVSTAPTADGTYPVYLRFTTTTMSGTLPDGKPYHDTGIPWVSYFNGGDALHGFIRSAYGYPQSLGCVEMPFNDAAALWPHTPIGTLVTVE